MVLLFLCGELVEKCIIDLCELNLFYVGWCSGKGECDGDGEGCVL